MAGGTRKLEVVWVGDTSSFDKSVNKVGKGADASGSKLGKLGGAAKAAALGLGVGLVAGAKSSIAAFAESEKVAAQTSAVLKSTGGAANVTAGQVGDLATAISRKSGLDDEAVQSGENLLLTFTNIRNEAGKGNDIFSQTSGIMADMSVALGQDMKSSALQLGKALNDPVKGVTALQRVGVSFTAEQKDQIASMVKAGDTMGAQKLILGELKKEFGGSAAAAGDTFAGKMDKLKVAVGNVQESIGAALVPVLIGLSNTLVTVTGWLDKHRAVAVVLGGVLAALAGAVVAYEIGTRVAAVATAGWTAAQWLVNAALTANPIGLVVVALAGLVAAVVIAWKSSDTFRAIVTGAFGAVASAATALWGAVKGAASGIASAVSSASSAITGAFSSAWRTARSLFNSGVDAIVGAVRGAVGAARNAADAVIGAVVGAIRTGGGNLFAVAADRAEAVVSGVRSLVNGALNAGKAVLNAVADGVRTAGADLKAEAKSRADAVISGVRGLIQEATNAGKALIDGVAAGIRSAVGAVKSAVDAVLGPIGKLLRTIAGLPGKIKHKLGFAQGGIVGFAQGGIAAPAFAGGGFVRARVGELGPEDVLLPVGAQVRQASESGGGGGGVNLTVNNYGGNLDELLLAERLGFMLAT